MRDSMAKLSLCLWLILAFVGSSVMAEDKNTAPLSINEIERGVEELSKGDYQDAKKIKSLYKKFENNIESELERSIKKKISHKPKDNMHYMGQLHKFLIIASRWKMSGTVDELAKGIMIRVDQSTMPVGILYSTRFFYPVANALADIGDYRVMLKMLSVIRTGKSREREIAVWVLYEAFGSDFAKSMIKSAADRERNSKLQDRLKGAIKLVDKGGKLILKQRDN